MRQQTTASNGHQCEYDFDYITTPPFWFYHKLKRSQAEKYPDLRENSLRDKTLRIQEFSDSNFPL